MSEVAVVEQGADVEVVVPMDRRSAEQLDKRIRLIAGTVRDNFVKLATYVEEAKAGNLHEVLGFASWTAYLADALGGQLEVRGPVRLEVVQFLAGEGMSTRGIAAITGASKSTIANDLAQVSNSGHVDLDGDQSAVPNGTPADEQTTVGLDGKTYRKPKPRKKPEPKPKQKEPKLEPVAEPESVSTRRVQIPTAFRAEADAVQQHARALHDLTTDPRWGKAFPRIAKADHDWLDDTIATLEGIRVLMCHEPVPAGSENSEAITSALDEESGQSPTDPRPESETADRSGPTEPDLSTPSGPVEPEVVQPVAETPPPVRPTNCGRCNVDLPASATSPLCDDCDGVPEAPVPTRAVPEPAAVVVHSEAIAKRNYDRRRAG